MRGGPNSAAGKSFGFKDKRHLSGRAKLTLPFEMAGSVSGAPRAKSKVVAYSTPCIYETPETERLLIFNRPAHGSMRCGRSMGGWSGRLTKPLTSGV